MADFLQYLLQMSDLYSLMQILRQTIYLILLNLSGNMGAGIKSSLFLGFLIRVLFMVYGIWQDNSMKVKYTDVDYNVFTDAAKFVTEGKSPYERATYRYTPLLAWILTPNVNITPFFGKLIFMLGDIFASLLIFKICMMRGCDVKLSKLCSYFWLFNPLTITVSTRGNAESIMAVLVLATLYFMMKGGYNTYVAAFIYAFAVHMKIYPVTYSLPLYLFMNSNFIGTVNPQKKITKPDLGSSLDILPNRPRTWFMLIGAIILGGFTFLFWHLYGYEFLHETYIYHITRKDTRHNFSPYFYMLYLTSESDMVSALGLAAFLPQVVLLLLVSLAYYEDLPFCCFLQTFLFVTFNKVCTSQYFLWYLCLLPLIIPNLRISNKESVFLTASWFIGQAVWLCPAYYLEFEGQNTFLFMWMAGLLFLIINVYIVTKLIKCYDYSPLFKSGKRCTFKNTISVPESIKKYL